LTVLSQINNYIESQPEPKRRDMQELHSLILGVMPGCRLWFLDGRDRSGRTVSNPNVGYGTLTIKYADGSNRNFYQIGMSGNSTGISVYIMGLEDKKYLAENFGRTLGKATVTGYCIKFNALKHVDLGVLSEAIRYGVGVTSA
jgi:hypothetical protein